MKANQALGIFDSGIGGLTVLKAIKELLPNEKVVYFGDTARQFYGEKSAETVLRYSIENSIFLMEHSIKLLVIACNTASAVSVEKLRSIFNIPVIGVIEPGAEKALEVTKTGRIAILATKGTIQSAAYQKHLQLLSPTVSLVPIACPLLAPLVEEGMYAHPATRLILREYLQPLKEHPVDTILLGCTHYPLLKALIQEEVGPEVQIVDSATTCAEKICKTLDEQKMYGSIPTPAQYFVSDNPEKFKRLGEQFLMQSLTNVSLKT